MRRQTKEAVLLSSISQCNNGHDVITYNTMLSVVYMDGKNIQHGRKNSMKLEFERSLFGVLKLCFCAWTKGLKRAQKYICF